MQRAFVDPHVGHGTSETHGSTVKCDVPHVEQYSETSGRPWVSIIRDFTASNSAHVSGRIIGCERERTYDRHEEPSARSRADAARRRLSLGLIASLRRSKRPPG